MTTTCIPTITTSSLNTATVLDLGSMWIRVGESGDTRPSHQLYSFSTQNNDAYEYAIFNKQPKPIIQNGQVIDFDALQAKLYHLQANYYPNMFYCVSLLYPYFITKEERYYLCEMLFETFKAKAVYFGYSDAAACFASGVSTGTVCDFGFGVTSTVPVVDGHVLENSACLCYLNGETLGNYLFNESAQQYDSSQSLIDAYSNLCRKIQLQNDFLYFFCSVSEQTIDPLTFEFVNTATYPLPDGTKIEFGKSSQLIPEIFFNTNLNMLYGGEQQVQFNSIQYQFVQTVINQPAQIRRELVQNVVLCGGVSQLPNFYNRFRYELEAVFAVYSLTGKPRFVQNQYIDKRDIVWLGGSIVSSLSIFGYLVTIQQEWHEEGITGVERRRM